MGRSTEPNTLRRSHSQQRHRHIGRQSWPLRQEPHGAGRRPTSCSAGAPHRCPPSNGKQGGMGSQVRRRCV